jgi:hypothetical protein
MSVIFEIPAFSQN